MHQIQLDYEYIYILNQIMQKQSFYKYVLGLTYKKSSLIIYRDMVKNIIEDLGIEINNIVIKISSRYNIKTINNWKIEGGIFTYD